MEHKQKWSIKKEGWVFIKHCLMFNAQKYRSPQNFKIFDVFPKDQLCPEDMYLPPLPCVVYYTNIWDTGADVTKIQ